MDWDSIFFDWLAWGLPMEIWYEYPENDIYAIWEGVFKRKQQEQNIYNHSASYVATLAYNYLRDKESTEEAKYTDFLPYDLTTLIKEITKETAQTFMTATKLGRIPPAAGALIVDCGLLETIEKLSKK